MFLSTPPDEDREKREQKELLRKLDKYSDAPSELSGGTTSRTNLLAGNRGAGAIPQLSPAVPYTMQYNQPQIGALPLQSHFHMPMSPHQHGAAAAAAAPSAVGPATTAKSENADVQATTLSVDVTSKKTPSHHYPKPSPAVP